MDVNLGADEIERIIPHRYPFLLVDQIVEIEDGAHGVGIKNVTANEWFFEGHFPGNRVMPGVLIVEALAQVAAVTLLRDVDQAGKIPMFGGIEKMRFRRPVLPGDQLRLSFKLERMRGPVGRGAVEASVAGNVVADGTISFALVENPSG
ncbi:MAG: 3-hydroxyacyl-[acyl-carrier-protein] dehydratase FabZ [Dehalococcoidia bacterium]|nr:3-hydroxyacyl-[acyl-carrier-protein] dehydratase FabZ [Dehalococcoidia bacterium]|tara:strand:+ start:745 stop:1191 length:447 start_codon:yes stop_codon:yes gene_type:complete